MSFAVPLAAQVSGLECDGSEAQLTACSYLGWGNFESCALNQVAGVACGLNLVDSGSTDASINSTYQYADYPCEWARWRADIVLPVPCAYSGAV